MRLTNTRMGHDVSGHVQVRLRHHTTVGDPKHGTSTSRTVRRPCELDTTPHAGQPITDGSDSTQ